MALRKFMNLRTLSSFAHINRVPLEAVLNEERANTLGRCWSVRKFVRLLYEFVKGGMPSDSERAGYGPDTAVTAYVVVRLKIVEVAVVNLHGLSANFNRFDWFHILFVFVTRAVWVMYVARKVVVNFQNSFEFDILMPIILEPADIEGRPVFSMDCLPRILRAGAQRNKRDNSDN